MSEEPFEYNREPIKPSMDGINNLSDRELIELDFMLFEIRNTPSIQNELNVVRDFIDKIRSDRYKKTSDKDNFRYIQTGIDPFPMLNLNDVQLLDTMFDIIIRRWDKTVLNAKYRNEIVGLRNNFQISAMMKQKMKEQSENK
jgi:hypothetical protein